MDFTQMGFIALMTVGFVNVLTMWMPTIESKKKIFLSVGFAFLLTFVPADFGNMLADKLKIALEVAFAATGAYRIAQKAGGS